jgi:hypothetical protein
VLDLLTYSLVSPFVGGASAAPTPLNPAGAAILVVSITGILALLVWTYGKVLRHHGSTPDARDGAADDPAQPIDRS